MRISMRGVWGRFFPWPRWKRRMLRCGYGVPLVAAMLAAEPAEAFYWPPWPGADVTSPTPGLTPKIPEPIDFGGPWEDEYPPSEFPPPLVPPEILAPPVIPEPATMVSGLIGVGIGGLILRRRRRREREVAKFIRQTAPRG